MSSQSSSSAAFRVSDLPNNGVKTFDLHPTPEQNKAIAAELDLISLRKMRFQGRIKAVGKSDWQLSATFGATIIQPCAITLEPVTTRIDKKIERRFVKDTKLLEFEADEVEMPEDDTIEPLGEWIDLEAVMIETLSLLMPDYPRVSGATLGEAVFTQPSSTPMRDADARPFAALATLKAQLDSDSE